MQLCRWRVAKECFLWCSGEKVKERLSFFSKRYLYGSSDVGYSKNFTLVTTLFRDWDQNLGKVVPKNSYRRHNIINKIKGKIPPEKKKPFLTGVPFPDCNACGLTGWFVCHPDQIHPKKNLESWWIPKILLFRQTFPNPTTKKSFKRARIPRQPIPEASASDFCWFTPIKQFSSGAPPPAGHVPRRFKENVRIALERR